MRKLCTLFMIALCGFFQQTTAQIEVLGSDDYGRVFNITYDPIIQDKVYATTLGNHIVVSEDNGAQWSVLFSFPEGTTAIEGMKPYGDEHLSFYVRFSPAPSTQKSLYLLNTTTLQIDHQYTLPTPDPNAESSWVSSYSIYKQDSDVALVDLNYRIGFSNFSKIYYTTNGGSNWDMVYYTVDNLNIFVNNVAISPNNPQKMFLARGQGDSGTIGGILISDDAGATWSEKIPGVTLQPIAFNPSNPDEMYTGSSIGFGSHDQNLYHSTDAGDTWNTVPISWTDGILNCINVIAFNPDNPNTIIVLEENEIVVSTDGGTTWQNHVYLDEDVHSYYYGLGVTFNPFQENELFISANYHALFTDDTAETVSWSKNPYFNSTGNINYVDFGTEEHLYYGVQFGYVHRNMNTQVENDYEIMPLNFVSNNPGTTVFADAQIPGRIYTFSGSFMGSNLSVSNAHGAASDNVFTIFSSNLHAVASHPDNENIIWASFSSFGENPELYEIDFSDINNIQNNPLTLPENDLVTAIHRDPSNADNVMLAIGTWIYKSNDGGATWSDSSQGLESLIAFEDLILHLNQNPLNENQFTLATNRGIFTSVDGGETWEQKYNSLVHNIAHSTETDGHIVATTHNSQISSLAIVYSTDGGENWEVVAGEELWHTASNATAFKFYENHAEVFIGTYDLGLIAYNLNLSGLNTPIFENQHTFANIYPNPTANQLNIHLQEEVLKEVAVYSITGQRLITAKTSGLDISHLPAGVYLVNIQTESGKTTTQKLIKK